MRILVTGGTGMVGSAFQNLKTDHDLILVGSEQYDLRNRHAAEHMFHENPVDAVIHLAAKVGGVKGNSDYVADFFYDNIIMNTNVLDAAKNYKIPKLVSLLSTCIYPDDVTYPLTEDQIHNGEPHKSNFGYAYAKRMLEVHSRAIRQQYGLKYITAVPNNIYGPNDNFDLQNGHVVPAMIRKIHEASENKKDLRFWGSGRPLREFTYSEDIAKALLLLLENYDEPTPVNIGTNEEVSIFNLAQEIITLFDYDGYAVWDTSMPEGQHQKPSCGHRFSELFPDFSYTSLEDGLRTTVDWFKENYPNVRGV